MISEVDAYVGRILTHLDQLELTENTIVFFLSDHGEWLGDHLRYGKGYPGDDAVSRVPLIVRWPAGVVAPGRTITQIVEAVDVVPTLLECVGMQIPPRLQGQSFAQALTNEAWVGRGAALMEYTGWKAFRTPRYRYLIHAGGHEKLWDLQHDPGEYVDVANDTTYRDVLAEQRRLLLQRLIEIERPLPRTWPY